MILVILPLLHTSSTSAILLKFHFQLVKMGFVATISMYHHLHVLSLLLMTLPYQYLQQIRLVVVQDHQKLLKVSGKLFTVCSIYVFPNLFSGKNIFVRVDFHSDTRTLSCKFLEPFKDGQLSCFATIFYGESCQQYLGKFSGQIIEDTSAIVLELEDDIVDYCYNITASTSNSNLSLSIKGFFTYRNGMFESLCSELLIMIYHLYSSRIKYWVDHWSDHHCTCGTRDDYNFCSNAYFMLQEEKN